MVEFSGWNLWELDCHHGEMWESRMSITANDPTVDLISITQNAWAVFRRGINPFWENDKNAGRLTAENILTKEIFHLIRDFYYIFGDNENVCGIYYTRRKRFSIWLSTIDTSTVIKKEFVKLCNREEHEIEWENFEKDNVKKQTLHLQNVVWKYGHLCDVTQKLTPMSVYKLDIFKASPQFIIIYKYKFPIECIECFLVELEFKNGFGFAKIKIFIDDCFLTFQHNTKLSNQIDSIAKALAIKIENDIITMRFYTNPVAFCKKKGNNYSNFIEVLICFANEWKSKILQDFTLNDVDVSGYRAKDRDFQFRL